MSDTVTWRSLLAETQAALGDPMHARWICENATSTSPSEFREMLDDEATERTVAHLDAMVSRALTGEPIQYVLGSWAFRHLDLAIDQRVLIPRPETEDVAAAAIELATAAGPIRTVADLGTGSGAIGLSLAGELPVDGTTVWLTDESSDAIDVAQANIASIGRLGANVRMAQGSWFEPLPRMPAFDVIVSNPPYVAEASAELESIVEDWEPGSALFAGPDGLDDIRTIVAGAPRYLRAGGWLVLEHGHDQGAAVRELCSGAGLVDIETRRDLAGLERCTFGRRSLHLCDVPFAAGTLRIRHLANTIGDVVFLLRWLTTPDVLEWYEGRDQTYDLRRVLEMWAPGGQAESEDMVPAIIELNGEPIGYIQFYDLGDAEDAAEFDLTDEPGGGHDVWSMDLFIGEPEYFGRGIGRAVCRAAAEFMLSEWEARDVVILPYVENLRAIASYRAAGFVGDHVVVEHEMHEGQMRDGLRLHYRPSHDPTRESPS